jgi:hypothetical protein
MTYQVTIKNNSNFGVSIQRPVALNQELAELTDVNIENRSNNSVLMYNASTGKYDHVDPFEILDRADGVDDGSLNYGTY